MKDTKRTFACRTKIWKLNQIVVRRDFNYYNNKSEESSEADWSIKGCFKILERALLGVTKRACGLGRAQASHREAW